ncbi:hypothetical protein A2U01_0075446, partial [Trifolium medium]|nr:hypothetical protein [Trifolium medium]
EAVFHAADISPTAWHAESPAWRATQIWASTINGKLHLPWGGYEFWYKN